MLYEQVQTVVFGQSKVLCIPPELVLTLVTGIDSILTSLLLIFLFLLLTSFSCADLLLCFPCVIVINVWIVRLIIFFQLPVNHGDIVVI